jgi:hypothetical protein
MYSSGKHSLFLYTLTNFDAISHTAVTLSCTNVLKIWQGSAISFARYDYREGGFAESGESVFDLPKLADLFTIKFDP